MAESRDEDNIVITPPKPLTSTDLEVLKYHKLLTEFWQKNSNYKSGLLPKSFFGSEDYPYYSLASQDYDSDLDEHLTSLFENSDSILIPDELIFSNKTEVSNSQVVNVKASKHKLSDKLLNIEMREKDEKTEESDQSAKERSEHENLFNDADSGDYKYSFCEEEDADHEMV